MLEGIGNMVLTLPALEALHTAGHTVSVCGKHSALDIVPDKFRAYTLNDLETITTPFDAVLLSPWSDAYIEKYGRKPPIGEAMIYESDPITGETHEAMLNFDLAACIDGVEMPESLFDIQPPEIPTDTTGLELIQDGHYMVFANCAAPGWEKKRWQGYSDLAHLIADEYHIVVLGSEDDKRYYDPDYFLNTESVFDAPLRQIAAILDNAEWVVGNDCGLTHIASALGTKTVALFGATSVKKNRPLGSLKGKGNTTQIFSTALGCSPCQYEKWESVCSNWECTRIIPPEFVANFIQKNWIDLGMHPSEFFTTPKLVSGENRKQELAVVMRVKDAEDTIEECLTAAARICDQFIIVDNGSTDGTLEYLNDFKNDNPDKFSEYPFDLFESIQGVVPRNSTEIVQTIAYDQPRDRQVMNTMLKNSGATWGLFLDADEIVSDQITREQIEEWMHQNTYNAIKFRHVHFWNDTDHYRTDQRWKPRHNRMMWRITPESTIQDDAKVHPGIVHNLKGRILETDHVIKHYGHIDKKGNAERADFYQSMDNASMQNFSGNTYQHMTDESECQLAEWHEATPIADRDFGKPSLMIVMMHAKGDMLMATPTIRALALQNPDLEISVMGLGQTEERDFKTYEIFENNPFVHKYYDSSIDRHPVYWEEETFLTRDLPVIEKDLNDIQQLTRFDEVVIVTLRSDYKKHRIDRFANACEVELTDKRMQVFCETKDDLWVSQLFNMLSDDKVYHGISIHRWCGNPTKSWDYKEYKTLVEHLAKDDKNLLILWDMGDPEASIKGDNIINMRDHVEALTISRSAALMDCCHLHIGADSFPMHLASASDTPTLAIFERSLASTAAPLNENSTIAASVYSLHTGDPAFYEQHAHRIAPCGLDAVKAEHLYPILHKMGFIEDADFTPFPVREFEFMGHQIVSPEIDGFVYEDYETDDLNELKACEALNHYVIPNESVFMDVGANVGRNSLMIRGDIKKGIAIEPFPEICNMLVSNLADAGKMLEDGEGLFTAYPIALAAEAGELYLNWSPRQSGCTSVKTFKEYLSIKVEATTMDALGHQPDLIKIDVEGAAADVLKGAEKTLETARAIVLEIHNDAEGIGVRSNFLDERGFCIRYISPPVNGVTHHILATAKGVEMLPYPTNCLFDPAEILTALRNDVYPSERLKDIVEATPEFNPDGTQWFEYMGLQTLKAGRIPMKRIGVYEGDQFLYDTCNYVVRRYGIHNNRRQ